MRHTRIQKIGAGQEGSATVELVLVTPLLITMLLVTVGLGRLVWARLQVDDAAQQAARAATLGRTPATASSQAQATATTALASAGLSCTGLTVRADTTGLRPGGTVRVTVSCTASLAGVSAGVLPGAQTLSATAASPVDAYRQVASGLTNADIQSCAAETGGGLR